MSVVQCYACDELIDSDQVDSDFDECPECLKWGPFDTSVFQPSVEVARNQRREEFMKGFNAMDWGTSNDDFDSSPNLIAVCRKCGTEVDEVEDMEWQHCDSCGFTGKLDTVDTNEK